MPKVSPATARRQRDRVLEGAEVCFAARGFHAPTMDEIIAEVGMSSSTVYRYFPGGKNELMHAVVERRRGAINGALAELSCTPEAPSVREAFLAVLHALGADSDGDGFTRSARIAVAAWAELPRGPGGQDEMGNVYRATRSRVAAVLARCHPGAPGPHELDEHATLAIHLMFGVLAEQAVTGAADPHKAASRADRMLTASFAAPTAGNRLDP